MEMQKEDGGDKAIEYRIEEQRAKLDAEACTPVTKETFMAWHKKRREKRLKEKKERESQEITQVRGKGGRKDIILSGKALFKYDPSMFKGDDDGDADDDDDDEEEEKKDPAEGDEEDILELKFGLEDEEAELEAEIEAARKMDIQEDLFNDDEVDDVELDDLE